MSSDAILHGLVELCDTARRGLLGANYCYLLHLALWLPSFVQLYPEYIQAARYRCSVFRFSSK